MALSPSQRTALADLRAAALARLASIFAARPALNAAVLAGLAADAAGGGGAAGLDARLACLSVAGRAGCDGGHATLFPASSSGGGGGDRAAASGTPRPTSPPPPTAALDAALAALRRNLAAEAAAAAAADFTCLARILHPVQAAIAVADWWPGHVDALALAAAVEAAQGSGGSGGSGDGPVAAVVGQRKKKGGAAAG